MFLCLCISPSFPFSLKKQWARINKKTKQIRVLDVSCLLVGNKRKTYNADLSSYAQELWSALIHPIASPVCPSTCAPTQQSINLVIFTRLLLGAGCWPSLRRVSGSPSLRPLVGRLLSAQAQQCQAQSQASFSSHNCQHAHFTDEDTKAQERLRPGPRDLEAPSSPGAPSLSPAGWPWSLPLPWQSHLPLHSPTPISFAVKGPSPTQSGGSGTSEYPPHTLPPSGFQGLIISTSTRSLLIFLQNVFHDFTDITAAHCEWKRSGKSPGGSRAPRDWASPPSTTPQPQQDYGSRISL